MRVLVCASLILLLSACNSTNTARPIEDANSISEERTLYTIGVGDVLTVNVWGNPDLTVQVPVRPDGYISMPLLGDIPVSNIDTTTLSNNITELLSEQIRNPQVTVIVNQVNSTLYTTRVRVTGAVGTPTSIPWARGMTVLDAILQANGVNDISAPNRAKLYRQTDDQAFDFDVRLDDILLRGMLETNYPLRPGDVITVPERLF